MPPSVHSTGTTASAPAGIGAPVMMRTHRPGCTLYAPVLPAATSPTTGSATGVDSLAFATSADRTAYPSMAELSNGGRGNVDTTGSASTQPCASGRVRSRALNGATTASTSARCASTGFSESPLAGVVTGAGAAPGRPAASVGRRTRGAMPGTPA